MWNDQKETKEAADWILSQGSVRAFIRKDTNEIVSAEQLTEYLQNRWEWRSRTFLQAGWKTPWEGNIFFVPYKDETATNNGLLLVQNDPEAKKNKVTDKDLENTQTGVSSPQVTQAKAGTTDITRANPKLKDDTRILLLSPTEQMNPGLPKWLPASTTVADFKGIVNRMSERERVDFKRQLWASGYYGSEAIAQRAVPETGTWEIEDSSALEMFLTDVGAKKYGDTLNSSLNNKVNLELPNVKSYTAVSLGLPEKVGELQILSERLIGRRLNDDEITSIVDTVLGFANQPSTPTQVSQANVDKGYGPILFGGGPDSTALQYGKQLAQEWGLNVVQGFTAAGKAAPYDEYHKGLGMSVTGTGENTLAFHEWATANMGEGKLFKNVEARYDSGRKTPDGVAVVFNENVVAPQLAATNFGYRSDTQLQRFIDSIRRPGEWLAYNWEGSGPSQRGAYAINENVYRAIAQQNGIESNNYSITAQDTVARIHAENLWNKYNNWELAAVAFKYGDEVADSLAKQGGIQTSNDAGLKEYVRNVNSGMANWKPRFAPAISETATYGSQMTPAFPNNRFTNILMTPGQTDIALQEEFRKQKGGDIIGNRVMGALSYLIKGKLLTPGGE